MATSPLHMIQSGVHYVHKMDHRNGAPRKSQWTIPEDQERGVFAHAYAQGWRDGTVAWGLRIANMTISEVGIGVDRIRRLFMAKFIDGNATSQWHGYPADYLANQQDVPNPRLLKTWCDRQHINRATMRKIMKRQPCNL